VSSFAEFLADVGVTAADIASWFGRPRDDPGEVRNFPADAGSAQELMERFPARVGDLVRLPGGTGVVSYRGGGRHASVHLLDVTELGFEHVGAFVVAAIEHDPEAVLDQDVEGDLVSVSFEEADREDRFIAVRGVTEGTWVLVVSSNSAETGSDVARALVDVIRS